MKIEDPLSPSGDQPDLNKLRRTEQPLCVLGRETRSPSLVTARPAPVGEGVGGVWGPLLGRGTAPPPGHRITPPCASFIGAAEVTGVLDWSPGWKAGSCCWGACRREVKLLPGRWHPLSRARRCSPSGHSAARDTQSGRSGTPAERGEAVSAGKCPTRMWPE